MIKRLIFHSLMYWGNLSILILSGCIDFQSSFLFFLYLLFAVFPIGALLFDLLFGKKIPLDGYFRDMGKLLLGIFIIAITVFVFGLNFTWIAVFAAASLLLELYIHRRTAKNPFSADLSGGYPLQNYAILFTSLVFTFLAVPSFTVFQHHAGYVTVVPSPYDGSGYYANINAMLHHSGSFLRGFALTTMSNTAYDPVSTARSLIELFEVSFLKIHAMDIIDFHSVLFSETGILLFLVVCFVGVFEDVEREGSRDRQYTHVAAGFLAVTVFSYPQATFSLLYNAVSAWHMFFSWICLMFWMKLALFDKGEDTVTINTPLFYLASLFLLAAFCLHAVTAFVFVCAYAALLAIRLYAQYWEKLLLRKKWVLISALAILAVVGALYMRIGFLNENINIANVNYNLAEAEKHFKFQRVHRFVEAHVIPLIPSGVKESPVIAPLKAAWVFISYAEIAIFLFLIYFLVKQPRGKILVTLCLIGTVLVILLVRNPSSLARLYRPGVIGGTYSCIMLYLVAVMMVIDIAASGGAPFVEAIKRKWAFTFAVAAMAALFTYVTFSRPFSVINIPDSLFSVIQFVKEKTPEDAVVMADLEEQSGIAYFSGFGLRSAVLERSGYERFTEKRAADSGHFFSDYRHDAAKDETLREYAVTHVLVSDKKPVEMPPDRFRKAFASGEWKLYEVVR